MKKEKLISQAIKELMVLHCVAVHGDVHLTRIEIIPEDYNIGEIVDSSMLPEDYISENFPNKVPESLICTKRITKLSGQRIYNIHYFTAPDDLEFVLL